MAQQVERVREETSVSGDTVVKERTATTADRDYTVNKTAQVIWFIVGAIVFLLGLRLVLALLGANPANAFANLIYSVTAPLVAPFRGLLQVGTVELGVARFELETLVAMVVYTLMGWGIIKLISLGRKEATPVA